MTAALYSGAWEVQASVQDAPTTPPICPAILKGITPSGIAVYHDPPGQPELRKQARDFEAAEPRVLQMTVALGDRQ